MCEFVIPQDEEVAESEINPLSDDQLESEFIYTSDVDTLIIVWTGLVEVKSFVEQLKNEIRAKGLCTPDDKRESVPRLLILSLGAIQCTQWRSCVQVYTRS